MKKVRERCRDNETRRKVSDISTSITWGELAKRYFGKSAAWLYNKMNGVDGNGKPTEFNPQEMETLKGALCDLADRIRRVADSL